MKLDWIKKNNKNTLEQIDRDGVTYLSFPALEQTGLVSHAFSTKFGGVSEGIYATMNFSFTRDDLKEHVSENYRRMANALGVDRNRMVLSCQTHTTNVRKVTEADCGKGVVRERDYRDVDGLITNVPGITLVTFYADCVPLYIVDPVHKAIGLSHSGWRGTVNHMGQRTLEAMKEAYGTEARDVIVCIGPSICQDCYEVSGDVAEKFEHAFPEEYKTELLEEKENGKFQLNLWRANELVFQEAGVPEEQIHTTNICTKCNSDYLFSHRVMGDARGNLAAFLCLNESEQ